MTKRVGQNAFAVLILALTAAILLSLYLTIRHAQLETNQVKAGEGLCSFSAEYDCDTVLLTPEALTFGIPNSVYALLLYANLLFCGLVTWYLEGNLWRWYVRVGLMADFAAVGVSGYFAYVLLTRMPSTCAFCLALQACSLIAFLGYLGLLRSAREVLPLPREKAFAVLLLVLCLLLSPVLFLSVELFRVQAAQEMIKQESARNAAIRQDPRYNLFLYSNSPEVTIPVDEKTPLRGRADAKHTLVMFTDFQCGPCSRFHKVCMDAVRGYPEKVKVYFKHFPLGKACNPAAISPEFHPLSCPAAYAAEAARMQGKFWEYADLLFEIRGKGIQTTFVALAEQLGMDMEQFQKDIESEEVRKRVEADIALGNSLRLRATPGVFLDGRELVGNETQLMFWTVLHALDASSAQIFGGTDTSIPFVPSTAPPEISPATGINLSAK